MLTFDEKTHIYRWHGRVVPHVTGILKPLHDFYGVPMEVLEHARQRGSDVHSACWFVDDDDLNEDTVTNEVRPYVQAYRKFMADCKPKWTNIETPLYHRTMNYATTPDRLGAITLNRSRLTDVVIEIKTAAQTHWVWGLQTMAQAQAAERSRALRFSLQLLRDGTYKLRPWTDPEDWSVFIALLTLRARVARET